MIHYRDMTFCTSSTCPKRGDCPRALTDEVLAGARCHDLPISQANFYSDGECLA